MSQTLHDYAGLQRRAKKLTPKQRTAVDFFNQINMLVSSVLLGYDCRISLTTCHSVWLSIASTFAFPAHLLPLLALQSSPSLSPLSAPPVRHRHRVLHASRMSAHDRRPTIRVPLAGWSHLQEADQILCAGSVLLGDSHTASNSTELSDWRQKDEAPSSKGC